MRSRFIPLPGGTRRRYERGWIDAQGFAWQQFVGPLNAHAAGPGYRLLESEHRTEEFELGEDMLYTAALHAGFVSGEPEEIVEVPDVRVAVGLARRNPTWEAYAADPDATPLARSDPIGGDPLNGAQEPAGAIGESQLLARAREVAAGAGDPEPVLIQHARGTRFEVTRTTGLVVFSDAPSYIVVMAGSFRARSPRPPLPGPHVPASQEFLPYRFQILVFDTETGHITDSGSSNERPDLTPLGHVVTYRGPRRD